MRPLRVGIVAESYYPTLGGIQEHVRHLRNLLDRRGVEVTILTGPPDHRGGARPRGRRARRGPRRPRPHLSHRRDLHARRRSARSPPTTSTARFARGSSICSTSTAPVIPGLAFCGLSMFRGPKVLTLHNAVLPRRGLATPDRGVLPMGLSSRRCRHRGVGGDLAGRGAGTPISNRPSSRTASTSRTWRASPSLRYLRPGTRNIVYLGRLESRNGPEVAIEAFNRDRAGAARRPPADGRRRADARRRSRRGSRRRSAGGSSSWARSSTSAPSCSPRPRCSCCRRARWGSRSWCWRRSRPACPWWRCRVWAPIAPASTGPTWSWPRTTASTPSPPPSARPCSAISASASRAGASSPTRSTGSGSAGGSSTSFSASPETPGAERSGCVLARRRLTMQAKTRSKTRARVGLVLRLVPLCLLAGVLWREKPWAVRVSPQRALGGDRLDPAQPRRLPAHQGGALAAGPRRAAAVSPGAGRHRRGAAGQRRHRVRQRRSGPRGAPAPAGGGSSRSTTRAPGPSAAPRRSPSPSSIFVAALTTKLGTMALAALGGRWRRLRRPARSPAAFSCRASAAGRACSARWRPVSPASTPRRVAAMAALSVLGWASEIVMLVLFQSAFHLPVPSFRPPC